MYPVAFLGGLKRGAICVPTSTLFTPTEIDFVVRDSGSAALVIDKAAWRELAPHLSGMPSLKHALLVGSGEVVPALGIATHDLEPALASIETFSPPHPTAAMDPAYLVYTSGTTSHPKGVLHAHRALLGRTPAAKNWFDFHEGGGERILHCGKFNWTYVLGTAMMDPFYWGKTVIVSEGPSDAHTWPRLIARHHATVFIGVPTVFLQILAKTTCGKSDVPTLSHCMSAGEHLSDQVLAEWQKRFGLDIHEALGMTEFSYYLSQSKARPIRPGAAKCPSSGHGNPGEGTQKTLEKVPPGEPGMICVPDNDPGLFLGYWNSPDETARLRKNGWFLTGDFACCDPDGYIWFLGRKDDMINSFGYRVSPNEVERVFKSHSAVADCACIGESHGAHKLLVVAYVIPKPESTRSRPTNCSLRPPKTRKVQARLESCISHERPTPCTQNGKIRLRHIEPSMAIARSGADSTTLRARRLKLARMANGEFSRAPTSSVSVRWPTRALGPGEVLLKVKFAALNPADAFLAQALYPAHPPLPHILGRDGVGEVLAAGSGVAVPRIGETVGILRCNPGVEAWGTLAEKVVVNAASIAPVPAGWSLEEMAGAPLVFLTAWQALTHWSEPPAPPPEGAVLLVTGASGGVGTASVLLGKSMNLTVVALSRCAAKAVKLKELGADVVLNPEADELRKAVLAAIAPRKVDLVVDSVGGVLFSALVATLGEGGKISVVGRSGGVVPEFNTATLFFRRNRIGGVSVGSYTRPEAQAAWAQIVARLDKSNKRPVVDQVFPFEDVKAAFARLAEGPMGKVLVRVGP